MSLKVAFIRGQYINNFELQSYYPILSNKRIKFTGFSSLRPKHHVNIPTQKLISPVDLPDFPYKFPILNRIFIDAMYLHGLERRLKHFDLAHARETYFHFSFQAAVARNRNYIKKLLVTCSETIPFNHETIPGRQYLKKYVINSADHFHTLTQKAKDCLVEEGADPEKITVIPYGIELERFKPKTKSPQPTNKSKNSLDLLFVGRLENQKGILELIEAFQQLKKNYPDIHLRVVGKGPLEYQFHKLGIQPEQHPYSKMPEIFQQADILIHPPKKDKYWEEYFGMVLLEAMASKLPIITTDCGAIPEVVQDSAIIAKQNNARSLFQATQQLIKNSTKRQKLAEKGYNHVKKNYDSKKQAKKLEKLYLNIS